MLLAGFGITCKGRRLIVKRVESKEEVEAKSQKSLKEQRQAIKNKFAHLHKIGDIDETSAAFKRLPKNEQRIRKQSLSEKKFKMKNGNFVINPTRLILRNLPVALDGPEVHTKVAAALARFQVEREQKDREDVLAEPELKRRKKLSKKALKREDEVFKAKDEFKAESSAKIAVDVPKSVLQACQRSISHVKLMRSEDRKDADGQRRSLGFAFVDFKDHEKALDCLKFLNNNGRAGFEKTPIVEFSFDDKRALRAQELASKKKLDFQSKMELEKPAAKVLSSRRQRSATF